MKSIIRKLIEQWSINRKDNRGMTFVEVICAVAIFALVSTTIGGIIVFSARTYRKGISETSVQQEAQLAANNIGNIVKDACSVQYGESARQIKKDGVPVVDESGSPQMQPVGTTELAIITNEKMQYSITYDEAAKVLLYTEVDTKSPPASVTPQIIAKNISGFSADTDDFKESRTIKLKMTVKDESTGREYPMAYTMTSRNEDAADVTFVSTSNAPVIIFLESHPILVPGETYKIPISVTGALSVGLENIDSPTNVGGTEYNIVTKDVDVGEVTRDYVEVTIPRDTEAQEATISIGTEAVDGSRAAAASTKIGIRRINDIKVTYAINSKDAADGAYESKDAQYIFYANVEGSNLAKSPGSSWDSGYKKAQAVYWSYQLDVGGNTYTYVSDQTGETYSDQEGIEQYVKFMESEEDVDKPSLRVKLMQDMPSDFVLTVTATSKHTDGVNKANSKYPDDTVNASGAVTVTARTTKVKNDGKDLVLEPNEDGYVVIDMKGGTSNLDCYLFDCTNAYGASSPTYNPAGVRIPSNDVKGSGEDKEADKAFYGQTTYAKYINDTKQVKIHIGNDEFGNDYRWFKVGIVPAGKDPGNPDNPQNGAIYVRVRVRRVEYLKMSYKTPAGYQDEFSAGNSPLPFKKDATYQFKVDVQRWNLKEESTLNNDTTKYISPYAVEIHWEFKRGDGAPSMEGKYVCTDLDTRIDKNGNTTSSKKPSEVVDGAYRNEYLEITDLYNTSDGPCIKVRLLKDFPGDAEFTVYATALHSLGTYEYHGKTVETNRTKQKYADISDSVSLNNVFAEPVEIVADPTQGMFMASNPGTADHKYELCVPIEITSNIGSLDAQIVGNQQSGTKVLTDLTKIPSSSGTAYVYLAIDPKEEGGGSGSYKIANRDNAYNCAKGDMLLVLNARAVGVHETHTSIASIEIPIHLRRVEKVKITKQSSSGSQLVLNGNVTEGCGAKWKDYFKKQDAEWDEKGANGYVGYKTPYSYKWELSYDDGATWILLDQNSDVYKKDSYIQEHIKSINITNPTDDSIQTEGTLQLDLNKALDKGTMIKMTSLHAFGENRGGQFYKDVFDIYTVSGGIMVADGFQRADDWDFASNNKATTTDSYIPAMRSYFTDGIYNSSQRSFFRYKEEGTDWNKNNAQYRIMDSDGERAAFFSGNYGSRLFLPDKAYELEIVNVVYGTGPDGQKVIYWPQDESLLEAGKGWKEEGYTLWDGTWGYSSWGQFPDGTWGNVPRYKETYEYVKANSPEPYRYIIPRSEIYFDKVDDANQSITEKAKTVGSAENPIQLSNGGNNENYDRHFAVKLSPTSFNVEKTQEHFTATIDKLAEDGTWSHMVDIMNNQTLSESQYKWFLQVSVPKYDIYHVNKDASGTYRIRSIVTGMKWMNITGKLFDTGAARYKENVIEKIELFDMSDESGVMYIKLN